MSYNNQYMPAGAYPDDYNRNHGGRHGNYGDVYNSRSQQKKRSGAKESTIQHGKSEGLLCVTAWNKSKSKGFITAKAFQTRKSTKSKGKGGKRHVALIFEVVYRDTGNVMTIPANYCVDTGKAYLEPLNMVISTKAPNGGYFGRAK